MDLVSSDFGNLLLTLLSQYIISFTGYIKVMISVVTIQLCVAKKLTVSLRESDLQILPYLSLQKRFLRMT